jgi:hypothetical protein
MSPLRTAQAIAALAPNAANYQEFLTSGTWTKPAGVTFVYVESIAAGGGGGNHTTSTSVGAGSGGEYVASIFEASSISATETITIGASGAGAADGVVADGSVGGDSSFGSLLTAIGGNPGAVGANIYATIPRSALAETTQSFVPFIIVPQAGYGGQGGSSGVGGNTIDGGAGGGGANASAFFAGGTSEFGGDGGAGNTVVNTKAGNGSVPGGGGGGSSDDGGGGDGGAGRIRVWSW